jgi:hypothetical protein
MILDCMDWDDSLVSKGNFNFMCRAIIPIDKLDFSREEHKLDYDDIKKPTWYDMRTS